MTNTNRQKYIEYIRGFLDDAVDALDRRDEEAYRKALDGADAILTLLRHEEETEDD